MVFPFVGSDNLVWLYLADTIFSVFIHFVSIVRDVLFHWNELCAQDGLMYGETMVFISLAVRPQMLLLWIEEKPPWLASLVWRKSNLTIPKRSDRHRQPKSVQENYCWLCWAITKDEVWELVFVNHHVCSPQARLLKKLDNTIQWINLYTVSAFWLSLSGQLSRDIEKWVHSILNI